MFEKSKFVLCVDDDEDDREMVVSAIKKANPSLEVAHAMDGLEAIRILDKAKNIEHLPCLIILDINMPRMNGRETLAVIKKDEKLSKLPVVVFSTYQSSHDTIYCSQYGVELLTKPNSLAKINEEINRLLSVCDDE